MAWKRLGAYLLQVNIRSKEADRGIDGIYVDDELPDVALSGFELACDLRSLADQSG